jgi:hypothetical protein
MKWKPHEIELLKQHYSDSTIHELMQMLNKTSGAIYNQAYFNKLKKSVVYEENRRLQDIKNLKKNTLTRFKKGQTPWNKNVKGYMGENATSFKKGQLPHNTRSEGETRKDKDGFVLVKIAHRKWIRKHRIIWEQSNGEIPKGYVIRIKDGNKENYSLDNMELITRADNMLLNTVHRFPTELKQTIKLLKKLKKKINEKQDSRPKKHAI